MKFRERNVGRPMLLFGLVVAILGGMLYYASEKDLQTQASAQSAQTVLQKQLTRAEHIVRTEAPISAKVEVVQDQVEEESDPEDASAVDEPKAEATYVVRQGDRLLDVFGKDAKVVCERNLLKNCNLIRVGQELKLPDGIEAKKVVRKVVVRLADGSLPIARLGVDPYGPHRTAALDRKVLGGQGYTSVEIDEYLVLREQGKCVREEFPRGTWFPWMAFGNGRLLKNLTAVWKQPEAGLVCWLKSGRNVVILDKCGNLTERPPREPQPIQPPPVVSEPPPVAVEPPPVEPPKTEPPPDEEFVYPVHAKDGDSIPCNLIAGAGVYGSRVYKGAWGYGEGICYLFKNGEWQHGPGFYAMGGGGESSLSSYRNKETGIGLQYGVQKNWINDRGFKSTFEVKARWLADRMWGSNPDSGYTVNQKGQKFGLYSSYYERHGDNLVGVVGEYWKSFGSSVKSSWSQQPAQDRGSVGAYGVYEHKLGDGEDWRLRWIAGAQHTNWDSQNWFRFIPEVRWKETVMFGPQVSLPIGVSRANQPMSASDIASVGAFVRIELGGEIRKADAEQREGQLEFVPAGEVAEQPQGGQLDVSNAEAADPPE